MWGMSHRRRVRLRLLFGFSISGHPAELPFAVTRSVTSQVMSIAAKSRDVNLVFEKISKRAATTFRSVSLDCR